MVLHKRKNRKNNEEEYYLASQWTLMGRKFKRHKLAIISLVLLGFLYFVALFGNFIAPSNLVAYNSRIMNAPPTKIHMFHDGKFIGPFVYGIDMERDPVTKKKVYFEDKDEIYKIKWFTQGCEYKLFGLIETDIHLFGVD
jgi:peptide/nickel transport system permease protein